MHLKLFLATVVAAVALQAQNPLSTDAKTNYQIVKMNILKAAEKMPDADYGFRPTPEVRTFGQLIAHVADAQMGICGIVKGEPRKGDAASKTSKADLLAALKASIESCDAVYAASTDLEGTAMVKALGRERPKLGMLNFNVAHDNEMYGAIAMYLRLKGIVPPSTEGATR